MVFDSSNIRYISVSFFFLIFNFQYFKSLSDILLSPQIKRNPFLVQMTGVLPTTILLRFIAKSARIMFVSFYPFRKYLTLSGMMYIIYIPNNFIIFVVFYHNLSTVVPSDLNQVYVNPGSLQGNSN